jgi:uncharacterized membrane protein YfcA
VKSKLESLPVYVFPVAALLTGVMSGLFGIGGGLLLNPVLLQIGVPPKVIHVWFKSSITIRILVNAIVVSTR